MSKDARPDRTPPGTARRRTASGRLAPWLLAAGLLLAAGPAGAADAPAANGGGSWSWIGSLLEPLESLSHWVAGLFAREDRFVANEVERFRRSIDGDLGPFDALVRQAGYRIASISVDADAASEVGLAFEFVRRLSEAEKAALMGRITGGSGMVGTIERSIIMTLLNAAESVYAVRGDGYRLTEVDIDVDVVPNVTFIMSKRP